MQKRIYPYLLFLLSFLGGPLSAAEPSYDFRIVIDVSGSMIETDPQNLRVPALKLINGLIPTGSKAGVWTFGRYVDMTVKWGTVNDAWRQLADQGADKIHSNAQLTNIESALARAAVGWNKPDEKTQRVLLLLTDGKVDVSSDEDKNQASRARLLSDSLAALKQAKAQVHTIALSDGTDEVLLKQLALETEGSFAVAKNAEALQKVFFKMFERASQPDTVALKGKEFPIDSSIREMTLLIFRAEGSKPTLLYPPDSAPISSAAKQGSRWRSDQGYDLITIRKPKTGTWRVEAEMDPDNRLMVVTDLKLEAQGIPAFSTPKDIYRVTAELFNKGKKISRNSFLRFVDFKIRHVDETGKESIYPLVHTRERKDKGQYLYQQAERLREGRHSFVISADSRTFNRSKRFDMQVQWPVEVRIEPQVGAGEYELKLRAREEYLKPDGLVAEVSLETPDGLRESLVMDAYAGWLRTLVKTNQDGVYQAHIKISAQSQAEEILDVDLGSFSMLGVYQAPPVVEEEPASVEAESDTSDTKKEEGIDWRLVGIVIVGVNLSLILLLAGGWWFMKRRQANAQQAQDSETVDDEGDA